MLKGIVKLLDLRCWCFSASEIFVGCVVALKTASDRHAVFGLRNLRSNNLTEVNRVDRRNFAAKRL